MSSEKAFTKGMNSEHNVLEALKKMRRNRDIYGFRKTKMGSPEDRAGVDFVVTTNSWVKVPLQVKSSGYYKAVHEAIHGDEIPCVIALKQANLIPEIKRLLREYVLRYPNGYTPR